MIEFIVRTGFQSSLSGKGETRSGILGQTHFAMRSAMKLGTDHKRV